MDFTDIEGVRTLKLDLVLTLAAAAVVLFAGYFLQARVRTLARYNIPPPVIGGLLFALLALLCQTQNLFTVAVDTTLRSPLQTIFFTTIGLGATLSLLRAGGWQLPFFLLIASLAAVVQNVVGVLAAKGMGVTPALGIICGALTLTGGPATGLAFTGIFEQMGVDGAGALIIASATFGIFAASIVGNPVATALVRRVGRTARRDAGNGETLPALGDAPVIAEGAAPRAAGVFAPEPIFKNLCVILIIMGAGWAVSAALGRAGVVLPGYIGAMVVAAVVRNLDDKFNWLRLDMLAVQIIGAVSLALFLAVALMDLKLWQLAGLAAPMLLILALQIVVTALYAVGVTFVLMGRDYEAAVMTGGHIGFGLGITPNAVANMNALVERYGPAPRSFLVVPIVGASFIDFTNSLIITASLKLIG